MTTVGGIRRRGAVRWEKLRHGQFANIIRTKTFGKGKERHSFELHLLPPLSAASSMKLHYHGIARSRDEKCSRGVRIHLLVCILSIRGETIYQNEKGKWRGWIQLGEREEEICRIHLLVYLFEKKGKREIIGGIIGKKEREKRNLSNSFCFVYLLYRNEKLKRKRRKEEKIFEFICFLIRRKTKRKENKGRLKELKRREKKKKFVEFKSIPDKER